MAAATWELIDGEPIPCLKKATKPWIYLVSWLFNVNSNKNQTKLMWAKLHTMRLHLA
jgi:hypothetical protein